MLRLSTRHVQQANMPCDAMILFSDSLTILIITCHDGTQHCCHFQLNVWNMLGVLFSDFTFSWMAFFNRVRKREEVVWMQIRQLYTRNEMMYKLTTQKLATRPSGNNEQNQYRIASHMVTYNNFIKHKLHPWEGQWHNN